MISLEDGIKAVKEARRIAQAETEGKIIEADLPAQFSEMKGGVFVTINEYPSGTLRGCIGYPVPPFDLARTLVTSARGVCHDQRFPPLRPTQPGRCTFEVSFLTAPEVIEYETKDELISQIEIGKDGLLMEYNRGNKGISHSSLYLPDVPVEENWTVKDYLAHICMKAGMQNDAWKSCSLVFKKFQAEAFCETSPNGDIVRK